MRWSRGLGFFGGKLAVFAENWLFWGGSWLPFFGKLAFCGGKWLSWENLGLFKFPTGILSGIITSLHAQEGFFFKISGTQGVF